MNVSLFGLAVILAVLGGSLVIGFVATWRRYAGKRLITCPENLQPAAVDVDALRAARVTLAHGVPQLRLTTCSRWPEKEGCGQECVAQIDASPEGCLMRTIVASWYAGKRCASCNEAIGPIVWHAQPPALLAADGTSHEWNEVAPEELPKIFRDHQPLCWPCHVALAFRRERGDVVIERPRPAAPRPHILEPTTAVY